MRSFKSSRSAKVALSVAVLGVGAAMAGLGTFATFTSTTSASHTVTSGTVVIALGTPGAANRLTVNATGVVPGDTMQRAFNLSNTGDQNLASVTLTTSASPSSALDTDATRGLQMVIDECSTAWTESGTSPSFTYTCGGTTTSIIASRPVIGSTLAMAGLSSLTAGGTDHLRLTLTFPTGAVGDNTLNTGSAISSTITYAFTGTQRAGTNQ